jgi:type IV secretory pathway TraG/TraD family ATPase VirD4
VLLDEAANIAPLRDLPALLSQAAGYGVRIATVWQSLGQVHDRYGHAADSILANSITKLFMGPVTDERTWSYLGGLLGDEQTPSRSETADGAGGPARSVTTASTWRPKASSPGLQQLGGGRAVLLAGDLPPAVVRAEPWYGRQ